MAISSARHAREALGLRLREIRKDADLTVRAFAAAAGWQPSKVSRLENGQVQQVKSADLRTWCYLCRAEDALPELTAMASAVASLYAEWRRIHRSGLAQMQNSYVPMYDRATQIRFYQSSVIPNVFRTAEYARAIVSTVTSSWGLDDDMDAAVAATLSRSAYLHAPGKTFTVLLEEHVLRSRIADDAAMTSQLGQLLAATNLPSVTLGIIPADAADRSRWVIESFSMFDDSLVEVELATARVRISQPAEVEVYSELFAELWKHAAQGREAWRLITAAIDALG